MMDEKGKGSRDRALTLEFWILLALVAVSFFYGLWHAARNLLGLA